MSEIGPEKLLLLLLIAVLLFGSKRLPEIGRSIGSGMREFREAMTGMEATDPASEQTPAPLTGRATIDTSAETVSHAEAGPEGQT
jgi:sec-independent protein translocase protein TatA